MAATAGLADQIAGQIEVPLVDGVAAAVRPRKAAAGSFWRPAAKPMAGLPALLVRLFGGTVGP